MRSYKYGESRLCNTESELKLPDNKQYRDDLIKLLKEEFDLSLRRLADLFRINREVLRRAALITPVEPSS